MRSICCKPSKQIVTTTNNMKPQTESQPKIPASSVKEGGTTLLLIDVQNDFHPGGSLAIPTAHQDSERIVRLIRNSIQQTQQQQQQQIHRIVATLDSHHKLHIAHPHFWVSGSSSSSSNGDHHPAPFTIISNQDIRNGIWKPRSDLKLPTSQRTELENSPLLQNIKLYDNEGNLNLLEYCLFYTESLEKKQRFKLCIWPEHCLIGTAGHNIVPSVHEAMQEWCIATGGSIEWVHKGDNLLTEMYSAFSAEVPISPNTNFNWDLLHSLKRSDRILVGGQALSHCVNYTVRDLVGALEEGERGKVWVLGDCTSCVPSFESSGKEFWDYLENHGGKRCDSDNIF